MTCLARGRSEDGLVAVVGVTMADAGLAIVSRERDLQSASPDAKKFTAGVWQTEALTALCDEGLRGHRSCTNQALTLTGTPTPENKP